MEIIYINEQYKLLVDKTHFFTPWKNKLQTFSFATKLRLISENFFGGKCKTFYLSSLNDDLLGYCVVYRAGAPRYFFAKKTDIMLGPYYIREDQRGKKLSEFLVNMVLHNANIQYTNAFEYIKNTNIPSIKCSERCNHEKITNISIKKYTKNMYEDVNGNYGIYQYKNKKINFEKINSNNYSVLMSVYKDAKVDDLKKSINSMLQQTIIPEQFVLVLDGPVEDELIELVNFYMNKYPSIFTIVPLKVNHGLAYALNEGIKACRNELIARMDGDDYSLPNRCNIQLKYFFDDNELSLLGSHTRHFNEDFKNGLEVFGRQPIGKNAIEKQIKRNSAFSHPTVMFRKSAVIDCGMYDSTLRRSQDHDLFSKMIYRGYKCNNVDEVLVVYKTDNEGILRNKSKDSCYARIKIQKRLLERKQCSIIDYIFVRIMVFGMKIIPAKIFKAVYSILKEDK